jgi:hypothetical protein
LLIHELTDIELLKLSLEYSINKKHQRSLIERINKLEGKTAEPVKKTRKKKVAEAVQQSFM